MNAYLDVKDRLLEYGIKPSLQRMEIMKFLISNPVHPTVDMIYNELYQLIPTLSKTTVYNTLKLFEESGVIQAIYIDEKNIRYDADISDHGHFRCRKCGMISDVKIIGLDRLSVENPEKLTISRSQVYCQGYCGRCVKDIN